MKLVIALTVSLGSTISYAQVSTSRPPFVKAVGQGNVSVQPDQAKIDFSVVTIAVTAQTVASQNASQVSTLIAALQTLLGSTGNIQTIGDTLSPNYNYPPGGNPVLTGYSASNTIEGSAGDLGMVGTIIDTGVEAGDHASQGAPGFYGVRRGNAFGHGSFYPRERFDKCNARSGPAGEQHASVARTGEYPSHGDSRS